MYCFNLFELCVQGWIVVPCVCKFIDRCYLLSGSVTVFYYFIIIVIGEMMIGVCLCVHAEAHI